MSDDPAEQSVKMLTTFGIMGSLWREHVAHLEAVRKFQDKYAPILVKLSKAEYEGLVAAVVEEGKRRATPAERARLERNIAEAERLAREEDLGW